MHAVTVVFHQLLPLGCHGDDRQHPYTVDMCCVSLSATDQCTCSGMLHTQCRNIRICHILFICMPIQYNALLSIVCPTEHQALSPFEAVSRSKQMLNNRSHCRSFSLSQQTLTKWTEATKQKSNQHNKNNLQRLFTEMQLHNVTSSRVINDTIQRFCLFWIHNLWWDRST